jgi:mercuric ion transport protein
MNSTPLPLAPEQRARRAALLNYFSLFGSFSTLICCALPSVLVLLGMGTAVASLLSAAPWLVNLSRHKIWTFSIAGTLIAAGFVMTYVVAPRLERGDVCAADNPTTCGEVSKLS